MYKKICGLKEYKKTGIDIYAKEIIIEDKESGFHVLIDNDMRVRR